MEFTQDNVIDNSALIENKFDKNLMPSCIDGQPTKSNIKDANAVSKKIL